MNIPPELLAGFTLLSIGGAGAWIKAVEQRLGALEVLCEKIDQLVTLMLEDRLTRR